MDASELAFADDTIMGDSTFVGNRFEFGVIGPVAVEADAARVAQPA